MAISGIGTGAGGLSTQLAGTKSRADMSPVEKLLAERKAVEATQQNYFKSETYFKTKANQLKYMIAFYGNLGLTAEQQVMEAEAAKLIKEYTKIYGVPKNAVDQKA